MNAELAPGSEIFAVVAGRPLTDMPVDLFIPPDALEVLLDSFTGPLDLLLYLIRRQNLDILDIPIAMITQQYMEYIHLMKQKRLELAADYLVMAAMLAEIKSRMLLPASSNQQEEVEEDPRMALVKRLQIYEQFKQAGVMIDELPRYDRDIFPLQIYTDHIDVLKPQPDVTLAVLQDAMRDLLQRQTHLIHHQISRDSLSVRDRMADVLLRMQLEKILDFTQLLKRHEGRKGLVVSLLAILELARQSMLIIIQTAAFTPIHLQAPQDG